MIYHEPCSGICSPEEVIARYYELKSVLGGSNAVKSELGEYSDQRKFWHHCDIIDDVAEGVRVDDRACMELGVQFIEADFMRARTRYIRLRIARALKSIELNDEHKAKLTRHFMLLFVDRKVRQEYQEYIKLFKSIGIEPYRDEIRRLLNAKEDDLKAAAKKLLDK